MARPSGDAAAGVSWSHPGGGCFTASGEGVRLGAILVGRRGRGFCCSVASSAGAGATLRLGPIVEAAQMAAQQRLPRLPQVARTRRSSKARSRAVVDRLRPPTESAAAVLLVWFVFGLQSHQLCISQTSQAPAKRRAFVARISMDPWAIRVVHAVCVFLLESIFNPKDTLAWFCGSCILLATYFASSTSPGRPGRASLGRRKRGVGSSSLRTRGSGGGHPPRPADLAPDAR